MRTATKKPSTPNTVSKYVGKVWGTPAKGDRVSINTPPHKSQRPMFVQNPYRYIKKIGGLDWNLFGFVTAIRRKSDGLTQIINGQNRMEIVKIISPGTTEVPAHIIEVDDLHFEVYGAKMFTGLNGIVSKNISNEELFYSQTIAQDPDALYMKGILEKCGISCGRVNAEPGRPQVVYATFKKCLKLGERPTVRTVELMLKGFKGVKDDPLHGTVYLLSIDEYKDLGDANTAIGRAFEEWFTQAVPMFHSLDDLKFKKYRNNPAWQKGIAYGLLKSFIKFHKNHGKGPAPKIKTIKDIYESGFKESDSGFLD